MTPITPQQAREMTKRALDHGTMAGGVESLACQIDTLVAKAAMDDAIIVNNEADVRRLAAERNALKAQSIDCESRGYQQALERASAAVLALKIPLAAKAECELAIERLMK